MTRNPPSLADVIDRLFDRMHATYGPEWARQIAGRPLNDVKTVWSHELSGYMNHLAAIGYALDNLPERCPNLIQFRNLCRSAPAREVTKLEAPKADQAVVKAAIASIPAALVKHDMKEWARRIVAEGDTKRLYRYKLAVAALHGEAQS